MPIINALTQLNSSPPDAAPQKQASHCIQQIFEAQAARSPDAVAVTFESQTLSYRELNERSNQLAHYLRRRGVGPDVFVGIFVDRNADLLVGLMGILKAGGTYVPIDPQYPQERLAFMLKDSGSPVIVTQKNLGAGLHLPATTMVLLDADWPDIRRESSANPHCEVGPDNLAYVIYTSGSTGVPKGTLISHRNVVRLFTSTQPWFNFSARDVWTLFHSCAFDFSVWEIWGALFYGGKLVVVPFGVSRTPDSFHRLLCDEGVTVLNQTPSAFRQLMRADEAAGDAKLSLKHVIFGGEALDFNALKSWFDRHGDQTPRLVNMYGITETTVHVTYRPISGADLGSGSVIGVPIPDLELYLLDETGQRVPPGQPGEIHVGGAGVARGYLNRPDLTAQKFIPDPFVADPGRRLYRSGDLGRYLPSGDLEYLGRIDNQVKIRGFRIELGEISAVIDTDAAVRESVVVVREPAPGEKSLIAYVVQRPGMTLDIANLRQTLRTRLPEYMVPSAFVFLERFPLTVNGKLDVKALPAPQLPATPPGVDAALKGSVLEQGIAAIWREVLRNDGIGLDQNFFDVGGNSINLVQVHVRMQQLLGREFAITDLFARSTVRALAAHFASGAAPHDARSESRARAERQRDALKARRNVRSEQR